MARLSAKLSSVRLKLYACMCAVHGSSQVLQGSVQVFDSKPTVPVNVLRFGLIGCVRWR